MKLVELVPGPDTLPEVLDILASVHEKDLGKGLVFAKDTSNFVANRIGTFFLFQCCQSHGGSGVDRRRSGHFHRTHYRFP